MEIRKTLTKHPMVLVGFLVWLFASIFIGVTMVDELGVGVVIGLAFAIPIAIGFFYLVFRYVYIRLIEPFVKSIPRKEKDGDLEATPSSIEEGKVHVEMKEDDKKWIGKEIAGTILIWCIVGLCFLPLILLESLVGVEPHWFLQLGYNFVGSMMILIVLTCLVDFTEILVNGIRKMDRNRPWYWSFDFNPSLRFRRLKAVVILVLYVIGTSVSIYFSAQLPLVIQTTIFSPKVSSCLAGYQVLFMSDLHIGPLVGKTEIEALVSKVNELDVDLILIGGDLADGNPTKIGIATSPLKNLNAKDGVFYTLGNHEYLHGSNGVVWLEYMKSENGIALLNNTRTVVGTRNATCNGFNLVGVDDFRMGDPDLTSALSGQDPNLFTMLLAHQPNQASEAYDSGTVDFQISGHVHQGQIFPFTLASFLGNEHFSGLEKHGDSMLVYTSQGAFGWGPRTRVGSRNNIDLITLQTGNTPDDLPKNSGYVWVGLSFVYSIFVVGLFLWYGAIKNRVLKTE